MRTFLTLLAITVLFITVPNHTFALVDNVNIRLSPETPGPLQTTKIKLEAYGFDIRGSNIIWMVDGTPVEEGVGLIEFTFTTKNVGERSDIKIIFTTPNNQTITKELVVVPAEIDLLWEADTYTPPFYKGKALPTHSSNVNFTAMPRFANKSNQEKNTYKWMVNRTQTIKSGVGQQSASYRAVGEGKKLTIGVEVSDQVSGARGKSTVDIQSVAPIISLYENSPSVGLVLEKTLDGSPRNVSGAEHELQVVPFFFSTDDVKAGRLIYLWSDSVGAIPNSAGKNRVLLVGEGDKTVSVRVRNTSRVMQDASGKAILMSTK